MTAADITRPFDAHAWDYCHDRAHDDITGECPTCAGYQPACVMFHPTDPSTGSAKTGVAPVPVEAPTPGRQVEPLPPAPSRPGVTSPEDRVSTTAPFTADRTITRDDIHLVTLALTDDAGAQHARDLYRHRGVLTSYFEMRQQAEDKRLDAHERAEAREIATALERRLNRVFRSSSRPVTQWELTLTQAEALLDHLEDAATEPETCAVGTCTGYAITGGSYCAGHDEVL